MSFGDPGGKVEVLDVCVYFVALLGLAPPPVRWPVLIDKLKPEKGFKTPITLM